MYRLEFDVDTVADKAFVEDVAETIMSILELLFGEGYVVAGVVDPTDSEDYKEPKILMEVLGWKSDVVEDDVMERV